MIKMYTNQSGIELLKHGYSAYVYDEPTKFKDVAFLIHTKNLKHVRHFYMDGVPMNIYEANGKISVVGD